ncbi:fumarate hydratase [Methanobrevibacter curvatus]|uniref:L(+)-tartrate dehydratase subunit alpha n=1 Tax=Methanobrevibacter curvatus TaxID=49547 RepID=A0A166C0S2_9EURY|nr:fumarate hydratase [Methanobrevibacter curvatus]KZX10417.1 L(+)-tartrate dehydratase subunit alpha [Methanobrevibacter curvatus]
MNLEKKIEKALISASTSNSKDKVEKLKLAHDLETNENAKWALNLMIENIEIANREKRPLCDDTGIPHVLIEVPSELNYFPTNLIENIKNGIVNGLINLPGRPMAVKGNDIERLKQSNGLYECSGMVKPPSFLFDSYDGDKIKIHILLLGGGSEIRSKTYRVFHQRNHKIIFQMAVDYLTEVLPQLGCTPSIPTIGIGRTHFEASALALKAMAYGDLNNQSNIEKKVTNALNKTNIGPMGLGGDTTVLGTFVNIGSQRASGVRIMAIRPACFVEPRVSTIEI